jgi:hypothetical protein
MQIVNPPILPAIVATVVNIALSALLHGMLFKHIPVGRAKSDGKMEPSTILIAVVATFLMMYTLSHVLAYAEASGFVEGMQGGFWMWLGFVMPIQIATKYTNDQQWKTFFTNTFCTLVSLLVTGGLLAAWH